MSSSGTSANDMMTFSGMSLDMALFNVSLYSSCMSNCMPDIFFVAVHSNQGLSCVLMNGNICSLILSSFLFDLGFEVPNQFSRVCLFEYD